MPKPIMMMIEVEEIAFGKVWRTLDLMPGVITIHMKGSGPKAIASKPNGKGNGTTIPNLILEALLARSPKTMSKIELEKVIEAGGKMKASLPNSIQKLKKQKCIRSIGSKGDYKITAAGSKEATTQLEK